MIIRVFAITTYCRNLTITLPKFDNAVRFGTPPEFSLVARKLLDARTVTVVSPAYLKAHGRPISPRLLSNPATVQT